MNEERIREEIAKMIWYWHHTVNNWEMAWDWVKDAHREKADQILSIKGIRIEADNQDLPEWCRVSIDSPSRCVQKMQGANFVRVINKEEK